MPTYRTADKDDVDLLQRVLQQYHPELKEAGVSVGLLCAHAKRDKLTGEPKGPAMKYHGYAAAAVVKVNSEQQRVEGLPDATVTLDGDRFPELRDEEKIALLDHELEHLVLDRDAEGQVKLDDCFRPKLRLKLHDLQIGGFESVVDRHGVAALEAQQYRDMHNRMTQKTFPWG